MMLRLSESGPIHPNEHSEIFPGVQGYAVVADGAVYVPWIQATVEGSGQVGKFLDWLPSGTKVPTVLSARLAGMLGRRGWVLTQEWDETFESYAEVWVKP